MIRSKGESTLQFKSRINAAKAAPAPTVAKIAPAVVAEVKAAPKASGFKTKAAEGTTPNPVEDAV